MFLPCKFSIYVPSTVDVDKPVDNSAFVEKTARFLSENFGGCTTINARGNWISSDKKLVTENVTIVYAYCTIQQYIFTRKAVKEFARDLCREMSQEAISVEFNNKLTFVEQA